MKKNLAVFFLILFAVCAVNAQQTYYSLFSYDSFVPAVSINDRAVGLQSSLYPQMYKIRSAERDIRWVTENDSSLIAFWQQTGDTILHIMTELSGFEWAEAEFEIYFLRHYPTPGSGNPMILALDGVGFSPLIEAVPDDVRMYLNLIFQLSRRLLSQPERSEDALSYAISRHPLMRPTAYRRDNLAMLLALTTCQNIFGYDSANTAYESKYWSRHFKGKETFERFFRNKWILSPSRTLADRILDESLNSALVNATRPPRVRRPIPKQQTPTAIAGISPTGRLGFSMKYNQLSQLVVDTLDVFRLGYANGLRSGDRIRRVEGKIVVSFRDLVGKLLVGLEQGGAEIEITRAGESMFLVFQPIVLPEFEEDYYEEDPELDSLLFPDEDFSEEDDFDDE